MAKSKKKQKAEAAMKASLANTAEAIKERTAKAVAAAAEVARETAEAVAASVAAAARKALGPTPKAVKPKKARHVRPAKRTPAVKSASGRATPAGKMLGHSVRKSLVQPNSKLEDKHGPEPRGGRRT
jgi:hypothetical protein